jgi:hypothetical protein
MSFYRSLSDFHRGQRGVHIPRKGCVNRTPYLQGTNHRSFEDSPVPTFFLIQNVRK